jgi:FkbM family methyltransferase
MAANSTLRRTVKHVLAPLVSEHVYQYFQGVAKAWDIRRGRFTEAEIALIPVAVRPGDTVVDVGANFGLYCHALSHAVGRTGRVFAFEPVPFTCRTLRLVVRILRLGNVEVVEKGLSDRAGTVSFTVPLQESGAASAGQAHFSTRCDERRGKEKHAPWPHSRDVTCEVVRLDDFLPHLPDLSFLKCDIEGAELFAFRGAEQTIDRYFPTVLCEINPWFLDGFGIPLAELTDFFFRKDYRLYHYDEGARRLEEMTDLAKIIEDNYVFIHPRRAALFRVDRKRGRSLSP